jgi:hypothetical protein
VNDHKTTLEPNRAEQLILSAARYKIKMVGASLPTLPQLGVKTSVEVIEKIEKNMPQDEDDDEDSDDMLD